MVLDIWGFNGFHICRENSGVCSHFFYRTHIYQNEVGFVSQVIREMEKLS